VEPCSQQLDGSLLSSLKGEALSVETEWSEFICIWVLQGAFIVSIFILLFFNHDLVFLDWREQSPATVEENIGGELLVVVICANLMHCKFN
jgi:hypothetical protein